MSRLLQVYVRKHIPQLLLIYCNNSKYAINKIKLLFEFIFYEILLALSNLMEIPYIQREHSASDLNPVFHICRKYVIVAF